MKKLLVILIIATSLSNTCFAQKEIVTYFTGHFGLANAHYASGKSNSRFSFGLGAEFIKGLFKKFVLNVKPTLNLRGYEETLTKVKATYFDLPVNIEYSLLYSDEIHFYIGAGLYGGVALGGKFQYNLNDWKKMSFGEGTADNRSRFDYGLNFTTGVKFANIKIGLQQMVGLKNVVPNDRQLTANDEIKLRNFTGFIAYSFGKPSKK